MSAQACTGKGGRGCSCAFHQHRRVWWTDYARRQRAAELARRQSTSSRCQRRFGPGLCDAPLEITTDGDGNTIATCPACARAARGICRDCPKPVYTARAQRCHECKRRRCSDQMRASGERHHRKRLAASRRYYQENPEIRRRRNEYKRDYRQANPDKVRAYKQRYAAKHRDNPNSAYRRYFTRWRKTHAAYYRQLQAEKDAEQRARRPIPRCTECGKKTGWIYRPGLGGSPWKTCMTCCWPHQRKARRRTLRQYRKRIVADPYFGRSPQPAKIRAPRTMARRGPGRERLCLTPGCEIVLTHRKKKCTKCLRIAAAEAAAKLAVHKGRGRRTDLEHVA